jgi:hypothetical protein
MDQHSAPPTVRIGRLFRHAGSLSGLVFVLRLSHREAGTTGEYANSVSRMRCTFYVDAEHGDQWSAELPGPLEKGSVVMRNGFRWIVVETWTTSDDGDESCWVALSPTIAADSPEPTMVTG